jgi:hypothetical protein
MRSVTSPERASEPAARPDPSDLPGLPAAVCPARPALPGLPCPACPALPARRARPCAACPALPCPACPARPALRGLPSAACPARPAQRGLPCPACPARPALPGLPCPGRRGSVAGITGRHGASYPRVARIRSMRISWWRALSGEVPQANSHIFIRNSSKGRQHAAPGFLTFMCEIDRSHGGHDAE